MSDLKQFQKRIGIEFNHPALLEEALTHSSYLNEAGGRGRSSNERLEFLGDAVLGLVVAERLFRDFPNSPEGELTKVRSSLIRRETLAQAATGVGLGDSLRMGKGEKIGGGKNKVVNLAGAFEAVIAAIYLDQGQAAAEDFILRTLQSQFDYVGGRGVEVDYKSRLQESVQSQMRFTPVYEVVQATGPDHDREFIIEVKAGERVLGRGRGKSKKAAEMEAARMALEKLA